jgi:hypothetical protein
LGVGDVCCLLLSAFCFLPSAARRPLLYPIPMYRLSLAVLLAFALTLTAQPKKKKVLAIGEVKGFQHDSVSHALATIERLGQESGVYDTYIRTDTQLLTKQKIEAGNAKNLNYFDAVIFYTTGELDMDDQQKKDLLLLRPRRRQRIHRRPQRHRHVL